MWIFKCFTDCIRNNLMNNNNQLAISKQSRIIICLENRTKLLKVKSYYLKLPWKGQKVEKESHNKILNQEINPKHLFI